MIDMVGANDSFSPNQTSNSFSFGVSREKMFKLHVDQITDKNNKETEPGPGNYELKSTFGKEGS